MRRATVLACVAGAVGLVAGAASAQEWFEDFDSYDPEIKLADQSDWEGWVDGVGSDEFWVSDEQALSDPYSVEITGPADAVHQFNYTSGVWGLTFWQYIPSDAAGGSQSLTLVNTYPALANPDWSAALTFDPDLGTVETWLGAGSLPLKTGQWVKIYDIVNLDDDMQTIYYGEQLLIQKSWSAGIEEGGETIIAAIDLWGNNAPFSLYYDDLSITEVPPFGACCFLDGSCEDNVSEDDCVFMQGTYQGHGTTCDLVYCPVWGECGWIVEAPIAWSGDTCEESSLCDLRPSPDALFEVILPYDAEWTFSVCQAQWDTYVYLSTSCCPPDGSPDIIAEVDDSPGCGAASEIVMELTQGTYYFTVEGFSEVDCGPFPLVISSPCIVQCDPDSIPEGEEDCYDFYEDDYNTGCNADAPPYPFTAIECGDIVCGTAGTYTGASGAVRDTDWYEFPLTEEGTVVTLGGLAEFQVQLLLMDPGPGDCSETPEGDPTYEVLGSRVLAPCEFGELQRIMGPTDEGYEFGWAWAGTEAYEGVPCGSTYNIYLTCEPPGECPADITGDGVVDVLDLLEVLSQWGGSGTADINGDGVVDVLDLLEVLGAWGPC